MIDIVLYGAPMGKERVKRAADGHAYTPERTVKYESRLALQAQNAMAGKPLMTGALAVDILAVMVIPQSKSKRWRADAAAGLILPTKKPDHDNIAKILDALNLVVWVDDAQIVRSSVVKLYGERPLMAVRVAPCQPGTLKTPAWAAEHTGQGVLA